MLLQTAEADYAHWVVTSWRMPEVSPCVKWMCWSAGGHCAETRPLVPVRTQANLCHAVAAKFVRQQCIGVPQHLAVTLPRYDEVNNWDFVGNKPKYTDSDTNMNHQIGHFTQLVWKDTTRLVSRIQLQGACLALSST